MTRKHFLALATLALLVAAFLRIWQLSVYPPGPHYDEAAELLIARSIAFGGARFFPMVEAYQGREVLFYYLGVPLLALVNDGIFSLRVLSVFCNLIAIAASMALGRVMFGGRRGIVVGLVVGVLMTLSFPMIWMARQAFRSSALPLMQALALLLLFKGIRAQTTRRSFLLLVIGGIVAGGALYTYNSSRLFPFWLLAGGLVLLWLDRVRWRQRLGQGIAFFGGLALAAAPMAVYAVQRPDVFWGRLSEVTQPGQSVTLAQSILLHLKMFFIEGDPYFRYNVAGRPYFTFPEGILLLLGIGIAARSMTRERANLRACIVAHITRLACLLVLLSPLMVIPSVISVGGLPPSHMRSLGMVPLIFVLPALGAAWLLERTNRWFSPQNWRAPLPAVLVTATLLVGAPLAADLYFRWASDPPLFYEEDADLAAAARWLVTQPSGGTPVYLAARDKGHPTVMIEPVPPITWLGTDSLFRPPPGVTGLYIFPHSAPPPADWAAWLAPGAVDGLPLAPDGQPTFQAFRMSGDTPLPVAEASFTARNSYLTLEGFSADPFVAGDSGTLSMVWRIDAAPPTGDFTPLIQVEDRHGSVIFRGDAYMAGTDEWRAGETLIQRMNVAIPPATPPGDYAVQIAWVGRASNMYAPYFNESGGQGTVWAPIGTLAVTRPAVFPDPALLPIEVRQPTEVAPGVALLGWDVPPQTVRPGETLPLTLYWQATDAVREAFTMQAMLRGADGEMRLWSGAPVDDRYPADEWAEDEILADRARWTIPREQPAGDYTLALVIGERTVDIATLHVAGVPRLYEAPTVASLTNVNFGGQVLLYGYTLRQTAGTLSLEIVWRALDNIPSDYKVFVHLISNDGTMLAQQDAMPQVNTYPTSWWLPDEFVVDRYELPAVEAGFALRVGLYSPADGSRLSVVGGENGTVDYMEIPLK